MSGLPLRPVLCAALALSLACARKAPPPAAATPSPPTPNGAAAWLTDVTEAAGLDFHHESGATGKLYFVELLGAGAALFDCDGDGDLDLLLRQGAALSSAGVVAGGPTDRLFRNDLDRSAAGAPRVRFVDVTPGSGVDRPGYGIGVATGDYDGDGTVDLYLTDFGPNRMLRGLGGCRFEDTTARAGVEDRHLSVPASFFDADRDGDLDLYVGHYVDYSTARDRPCFRADSSPDYCGPKTYAAVLDRFFANRGDGTFEDRSGAAGFASIAPGRALGAAAFDGDRDGWIDLFVANDATDNNFWRNRGNGTFVDDGLERGAAVNAVGLRTGDMGVEAADFDGDSDPDLSVTHLPEEGLGFWVNDGKGFFWERGAAAGMVRWTAGDTGFGTAALDLENDGWLDLYLANGAVRAIERLSAPGETVPLAQANRLLHNLGTGRWEDVTAAAGAALAPVEISRGVAAGDIDDDGDLDLVVTNMSGPARLLLSGASSLGPWLGLRLLLADAPSDATSAAGTPRDAVSAAGTPRDAVSTAGPQRDATSAAGPQRDAIGAEAELTCSGGRHLVRRSHTDGSYASAGDPRVLFGLAGCGAVESLVVRWPSGDSERFAPPPAGAYTALRQGDGQRQP